MSNRYEREIEEILRNLDSTESSTKVRQRFTGRLYRKEQLMKAQQSRFLSFNFKMADWLLITVIVTSLVAGGFAYAQEPNIVTGILAIISMICLGLVMFSSFLPRLHQPTYTTRYRNVTPIRYNPFTNISTRWHLFLLKLRYRRNQRP